MPSGFVLGCSADTAQWSMLERAMPNAVVTSGVISVRFNNVKVFFIMSFIVCWGFNYFLLKK